MRSHLATKRLSAYLDDELPDREQRQVEAHVSDCPACQSRLHGLRLVVSELKRVPAVEAPPSLARSVATEAAMRWGPPGPYQPGVLGRRAIALLQDMIQLSAVTAGAVAIIALLIAYGAARDDGGATGAPGTAADAAPPDAAAVPIENPAATLPELGSPDRAQVNGRSFVFRDGAWRQEDLPLASGDPVGPPALLVATDPER